jgi:hypothetical protein
LGGGFPFLCQAVEVFFLYVKPCLHCG